MMIEDGNGKEKPVENLESLKAELLNALDKGIGKCLEAIAVLDTKVVTKLGELELRVKVIQNYVANGLRGEGGTPRSGFVIFNSPSALTPVGDPPSNIIDEEARAEEVASQLMEMAKVKEKEIAEKENKDMADADLGNDKMDMDEPESVAALEKEKELADADLKKKKKMVEVKQELRDAVEKHVSEKEKVAKVYEAKKKKKKQKMVEEKKQKMVEEENMKAGKSEKGKEKDGEAEAVGKRKNEKESVGEDEEKKKRLKVEKVKKSLGDVELVATGTKRNRE